MGVSRAALLSAVLLALQAAVLHWHYNQKLASDLGHGEALG